MSKKFTAYAAVQISPNMHIDDLGQLICTNAIIAREGQQSYRRSDLPKWDPSEGDYEVIVTRPWRAVSDALAIASFESKPLIINHNKITLDNIKEAQVGYIRDVMAAPEKVGGYNVIVANIVIYDKNTIARVRSGELRELSCSYDCEIDMNTLEITDIRGLHVALVPVGRAEIARINDAATTAQHSLIDGADQAVYYFNTTQGFRNIVQILIDKHKFDNRVFISEVRYDGMKVEYFDDLPGSYRRILDEKGFTINDDGLVKLNSGTIIEEEVPVVVEETKDSVTATFGDAATVEYIEEKNPSMRYFTVVVFRVGWDNTVRHKLITRFDVDTDVVITKPAINDKLDIPGAKHIFKLEAAKIPTSMQVLHEFHKIYAKEIIAKYNFDEFGNARKHKLIPWGVFQMFFTLEYKITEITLEEETPVVEEVIEDVVEEVAEDVEV